MPTSPFTATIVQSADSSLGFLGSLRAGDDGVYAVGGTYHKPTLLHAPEGRRFRALTAPRTSGLRDLLPLDDGALLVCGEYGALHRSTDGGARWTEALIDTSSCLYGLERDMYGALYVTGDAGGLWRSTDAGETWTEEPCELDARLLGATALGDELLLLGGDGSLYRRVHGSFGDPLELGAGQALTALAELPSGTLIVAGDGGLLRRSTDRGRTWHEVDAGTDADLEDLAWTEHGLFIVGDRGTLLHASDDGLRVARVPTRQRGHLWSIMAFGTGALIGGDEGLILRLAHRDDPPEPTPGSPPRGRRPLR